MYSVLCKDNKPNDQASEKGEDMKYYWKLKIAFRISEIMLKR